MAAGCPFITCGVKRKGVEFCWECDESSSCERWARHRAFGRERDSFVCYGGLEDNIAFIEHNGIEAFVDEQHVREDLLREMLAEFNEGRSRAYYSIAVTLLTVEQVRFALQEARLDTADEVDAKAKSRALHSHLDAAASAQSFRLALRK